MKLEYMRVPVTSSLGLMIQEANHWRRWALLLAAILFIQSAAMMHLVFERTAALTAADRETPDAYTFCTSVLGELAPPKPACQGTLYIDKEHHVSCQ